MSLQVRIADFITAVGTDYKQIRSWITGSSSGDLTTLSTTDKSSLIAAINEVQASSGSPAAATETVAGVAEIATLAEMATGTDHSNRFATPAGVRQERAALKAEILGGVGPAFDTLSELLTVAQDAEESSTIAALVTTVGTKADASNVYTKTELGDPETDLVAAYVAAKA